MGLPRGFDKRGRVECEKWNVVCGMWYAEYTMW